MKCRPLSSFPDEVYDLVQTIPPGCVAGYGHVAAALGAPRKARHVGHALANLPPHSDVPWWRVLRSNGHLAYGGDPSRPLRQRRLLEDEGVQFCGDRVDIAAHRWEP